LNKIDRNTFLARTNGFRDICKKLKKVSKNDTYALLVPLAVKSRFETFDPLFGTPSPTFLGKNSELRHFCPSKSLRFLDYTYRYIIRLYLSIRSVNYPDNGYSDSHPYPDDYPDIRFRISEIRIIIRIKWMADEYKFQSCVKFEPAIFLLSITFTYREPIQGNEKVLQSVQIFEIGKWVGISVLGSPDSKKNGF
jgi:hypothetical protein